MAAPTAFLRILKGNGPRTHGRGSSLWTQMRILNSPFGLCADIGTSPIISRDSDQGLPVACGQNKPSRIVLCPGHVADDAIRFASTRRFVNGLISLWVCPAWSAARSSANAEYRRAVMAGPARALGNQTPSRPHFSAWLCFQNPNDTAWSPFRGGGNYYNDMEAFAQRLPGKPAPKSQLAVNYISMVR